MRPRHRPGAAGTRGGLGAHSRGHRTTQADGIASFVAPCSPSPQIFVGMVLILIFAEVLGLYGLIVSLIMNSRVNNEACQ